ncbi:DNA-binding domain-containing protein [Beijerinckia indica]|uniref:Putative DNA-binding domain-containing protein n=1 Tax=Beijerinckia indica subsp. indica (strain ATCC 9039 / DSM 1715 / NCIMB 8712) TaxID=395963 RepID=B2IC93_BEII9|nr:DNA-binding domain-containing protein [Beijerinckia indica]ACB96690.1 conserved hypothetical protein [Beijerinckia indica subsp. indica ATCC 9039]
MSSRTQSLFAAALLSENGSAPEGLVVEAGLSAARRFAVHRNNVVEGLARALASRFPITEKIVGEDFLTAMARLFVVEQPPVSPVLLDYGDGFPDFVEHFPPAEELPYLPDVMRLEIARSKAYHAADVEPLSSHDLATYDLGRFGHDTARLHPSVSIVSSDHPIVTLFAMNAGERSVEPIENWQEEDALVVRPYLTVHVHRLPAGGATFLHALASGATFAKAADLASTETSRFALTENLIGLIGSGALAAINHENQ